jgi:hypothetical protein
VPVAAASDNVRDMWHPYGDYDCLAVWREAVAMVGRAGRRAMVLWFMV